MATRSMFRQWASSGFVHRNCCTPRSAHRRRRVVSRHGAFAASPCGSLESSSSSEPHREVKEEAAARRIRSHIEIVADGGRADVRYFGIEPGVFLPREQVPAAHADADVARPETGAVHPGLGKRRAKTHLTNLQER